MSPIIDVAPLLHGIPSLEPSSTTTNTCGIRRDSSPALGERIYQGFIGPVHLWTRLAQSGASVIS
jgi:hypothetical protein